VVKRASKQEGGKTKANTKRQEVTDQPVKQFNKATRVKQAQRARLSRRTAHMAEQNKRKGITHFHKRQREEAAQVSTKGTRGARPNSAQEGDPASGRS
jgi:hypothetical protein